MSGLSAHQSTTCPKKSILVKVGLDTKEGLMYIPPK